MMEYGITWNPGFLLYTPLLHWPLGRSCFCLAYGFDLGCGCIVVWVPVTFIVYSFWNDPVTTPRLNAILFMKKVIALKSIAGATLYD